MEQLNNTNKENKEKTFTKKWMTIILIVALLDLQIPFILAFLDKMQIAETLGSLLITEIIAVFLVYCIKSFFGKKSEEDLKFKRDLMKGEEDDGDVG